ncbi:glycoside hydrolase/peptidoglycan hydrolase [uncultured phage cr106_1]|uniref:Glycoside hydrolase/peptidoglycan hydrolase n=1 Tax=uncultured phage cr106_1 TaxID=2772062 RepID=A0A7M1RV67_9CAUD|nr:glycoside hydrolase/peptidoglycan hydrolase [uncultured phage cr106_1]QOR58303.1 glycoside hydrolase/peptidoglycan hydrolase [uncultured phage cr106_1]
MKERKIDVCCLLAFVCLLIGQTWLCYRIDKLEKKDEPKVHVKLEQPDFLMSDNPKDDLMKVLEYYGVLHPEIVYAQAVLETGHFRSKVCKEYNNLFGLYNSTTKDYYKFNHWTESVIAYINYIQYRYTPPNNYYKFLERIGYAQDSLYVSKLKNIVKRNE